MSLALPWDKSANIAAQLDFLYSYGVVLSELWTKLLDMCDWPDKSKDLKCYFFLTFTKKFGGRETVAPMLYPPSADYLMG